MADIAIRVENLSKQYLIGGPQVRYKTIRESLTEALQAPFRRLSSVVRGQSSAASSETLSGHRLPPGTDRAGRGAHLPERRHSFDRLTATSTRVAGLVAVSLPKDRGLCRDREVP